MLFNHLLADNQAQACTLFISRAIGAMLNIKSKQLINIHIAPISISGVPLKLLTLSRMDAAGQEDIVFNVNRPESVDLSQIGTSYPYAFTYNTRALEEGSLLLTAKLVDIHDNVLSLMHKIEIDRTPPVVVWNVASLIVATLPAASLELT